MIETPIVRIEEISTLKSREKSITYENQIWRGSIQNCPPESKHDRKLLAPSRQIEERKTEVGLDQDHLLSASLLKRLE